ncbi:DUF2793 domain-containing protein [Roseivivax marinus]|uniref:DUF2793 domain-containing protein n=1 Tax=Roseivivax marinus TaxID=1379903 RepID=UPI001F04C2EC|nr:DUF2793 domain-containing protein [Roseivivax marinus]UMA64728.1 DUF2793 domain-containing protein [Roseivivax marinus]
MSDTSPILDLPYLAPAQAQKHVTVNEALTRLDILARLSVRGFGATTPPETPQEGETHALGAGPTGDWAGQDGRIACFTDGAWLFIAPRDGWLAVTEGGEARVWTEGAWRGIGLGAATAGRLGVNASADADNPLAVGGEATLLTHDGGDHRLKINKAGGASTASVLFQTDWTGRAEMGLAGSNHWSIKVSADGSAWTTALLIDAGTGRASGAAVQAAPDDATPGKLMRADYGYGPATLVGAVSEDGGTPTGAAIESGETGSGTYTRFADGTQICHVTGFATVGGAGAAWTFPKAFAATPSVTATPISGSAPRVLTVAARSTSGVEIHSHDLTGSDAVTPSCDLIAVGRWF